MKGLKPEDYLEPACIFCTPEQEKVQPIDLRRCLGRLDEYLGRNDTAAAERHLNYWKEEALAGRDLRGLLTIENERMGLYRKLGREADAQAAVRSALSLVDQTGLQDTVTAATTYLNVGTVCKCFRQSGTALAWYEQARTIYERELAPDDPRLAGLYNNLALVLVDLRRFAEARDLYEKALAIVEQAENGAPDAAITELNLANLAEAERGLLEAEDEIEARLDRAKALLDRPDLPQNGCLAFVCEKCAPTFGYYGRFADAQELKERSEAIYARA